MKKACPSRKRRYRDEIAAKFALSQIARVDSSNRPKSECRAYRCPDCRGWHLTARA
jgi:hypothetical protein